jgi:hypothetical protein
MLQLRLMQARRELVRRADHLGRRFCRGGGAVIGWVQAKQITSAASSATTPGSRMPHFSQIAGLVSLGIPILIIFPPCKSGLS